MDRLTFEDRLTTNSPAVEEPAEEGGAFRIMVGGDEDGISIILIEVA